MLNTIKLHRTYTPHTLDKIIYVNKNLVQILNFFKENPGEQYYTALQKIKFEKNPTPDIHTLKTTKLLKSTKPINGLYPTEFGNYVLEQIMKYKGEFCSNILIISTHPYPESINRAHARIITEKAYQKILKTIT